MKHVPQITVAITAFNESQRGGFEWIQECVQPAVKHPLVREIAVVNDGTPDYDNLAVHLQDVPKVKLYQNAKNFGVFGNKITSVERSHCDWVLMADSDNIMGTDYYDRLASLHPWSETTSYAASFARPNFDYRRFVGTWGLNEIVKASNRPCFWCLVNTGNWFVHRHSFLRTFRYRVRDRFDLQQPNYFGLPKEERKDIRWRHVYDAQDSFFINHCLWLAGHRLQVVDGLEYDHRVDKKIRGNYDRSPVEKEALAPIYLLELQDRAGVPVEEWPRLPMYTFSRKEGSVFYYDIAGSESWASVDMQTGIVWRYGK